MSLKQILSDFCKENGLEDLQCILHLALLNYVANLSKKQKNIALSAKAIDIFSGIGEEKAIQLLTAFSEQSEFVNKYYVFKCQHSLLEDAGSVDESEIEDNIAICYGCYHCHETHTYNLNDCEKDIYEIGFNADREEIINELKINGQEWMSSFFVLNLNENNIDKLANILVSKLQIQPEKKDSAKNGIMKYLHSVKSFTGIVADITGDGATITKNIKNMAEDISGFSSIKDSILEALK